LRLDNGSGITVDVEQVEDEIDKIAPAVPIGGVLDQSKGRDTVGTHSAELAVQVSLPDREGAQRSGNRRIFVRPVEPGAGQQPDIGAIDPRVNAISIKFQLVRPILAAWGFLHQ
jgi:hypothetical protein